MELKLRQQERQIELSRQLLIVPYGIETRQVRGAGRRGGLLIVPYGIETG